MVFIPFSEFEQDSRFPHKTSRTPLALALEPETTTEMLLGQVSGWVRPESGQFPTITITGNDTLAIPSGTGYIVSPETGTKSVKWSSGTLTLNQIQDSWITTIAVDSEGIVVGLLGNIDPKDARTHIILGTVTHMQGFLDSVQMTPSIWGNVPYAAYDLSMAHAHHSITGGNITVNSVNTLAIDISSKKEFFFGGALNQIDDPNVIATGVRSSITMYMCTGQSEVVTVTNTLPVAMYNPNGGNTLESIPAVAGSATAFRLVQLGDRFICCYGQTVYSSLAACVAQVHNDPIVVPEFLDKAKTLAIICTNYNSVDLNDNTTTVILTEGSGGGFSTADILVPDFLQGVASVTMTSSHVTLVPSQYELPIIEITGAITADLNLIFPNVPGSWTVINKTSGLFTITAKTATGLGVNVPKNLANVVCCNGVDIFSIGRPDVTPYDFGAKGDYFLSNGSTVNPSPTADQAAIMAAYVYCVKYSKPLKMVGDFYITDSINLNFRPSSGSSGRMIINAAATIYANLDSGATNAVYVGDDTAHGIYPLQILGQLHINNVGAIRLNKVGFHAQDSAYGYWCVTASDFDYGIYIQGCIYSTIDGGHRACSSNYLDMRIESYRSTNPVPILRFTNNILEVKNIRLASKSKLAIVVGASVASPVQHTGGLMRFDRVLFENNSGALASVPYTVYVEHTAETVDTHTAEIVFSHCWFEAYHKAHPLFVINTARAILRNCFIAHTTDAGVPLFQLQSNASYIEFDCTNGYFGDGAPDYIVWASGSATDAHRSNITVRSSNFWGPVGTLVPLHSGYAGGYRYLSYSTNDGSKSMYMQFDNVSPKFPTDTTNDYMKDATLNVADFVQAHFGTKVVSADIYIGATDGGSSMSAHIVYLPNKSYIAYTSDANLTISGGVLSFPTSTMGQFFRPKVHVQARVFEQTYALS